MAVLGRAIVGWLGEQAVDQALLVPSGGRLIPWVPLIDAHGVDRAYCWDGVGVPWFVQVKMSGFTDAEGHHRWDFRAGSLPAHGRFRAVLGLFNPTSKGIDDDVFWCMDAATVRGLGRREYDHALRTEVYRLVGSPTRGDRLSAYRHPRDELWRLFAPPHELKAAALPLTLPTLRIDQGGLYEFAMITELLKANHKDLLVFRSALDIHGRDLLLQLVGTSHALYIQVKGTAVRRSHDLIRFHIRRSTFIPADDFWLALYFWERRANGFYPECWLVSSRELARRTAHQRDASYLTVDARLNGRLDGWADCRRPLQDLGKVLRGALANLPLAA